MPLNAEIVTTGTEILLGDIVDTNAAWIAQQLREIGVNLFYKTTVGDNQARIRGVLELCMSRSNVVICSGGLGPTVDDVTRDAIAEATGCPLQLHENSLHAIEERFQRFGVKMTENNKRQAMIPQGAIVIPNPVGTAPGFIVEHPACTIIAVPGVPREMKQLMSDVILPYLRQRNDGSVIRRRVLRTIGIGESMLDNLLGDLMHSSNPTVGTMAHTGQADLRIAARAANEDEAETMLDVIEAAIRKVAGSYIYSTTAGEPYETVVARLLQAQQATVAVLESNTGGHVAQRLQKAIAGFDPVILQRQQEAPTALDEASTIALAQSLRRESGATYALAILGSSGEDQGIWGQGQGETWLAAVSEQDVKKSRLGYSGNDEYSVIRTSNQGLLMLERVTRAR